MSADGEVVPVGSSTAPGPVTVAVVDDNAVIRMGLRSLLEAADGIRVVAEAADGDEAIRVIRETTPDVVLLDVRMPRRDGVQVLAAVHGISKVLMLTYSDAPEVIRAAIEAGASGYLVHGQFDAEDLARTVQVVANGAVVLSPPAASALRGPWTVEPAAPVRPDHGLSVREREVMELVATGLSNRDVARECFLSEKTVKNHINHIFAKLGVRTRAEAVSLWLGGSTSPVDHGTDLGPTLGPRTPRAGAARP